MIKFYTNNEFIGEIPYKDIEDFFVRVLFYALRKPVYEFDFGCFIPIKLNKGFYLVVIGNGYLLIKDDDAFVIDSKMLYKTLLKGKEVRYDWEKVKKEKVWWSKINKQIGDKSPFIAYDFSKVKIEEFKQRYNNMVNSLMLLKPVVDKMKYEEH